MQMASSIRAAKTVTGISVVLERGSESKYWRIFPLQALEEYFLTSHRNINIPWPSQGMGDGDYMYAFQQVVMPIANEFNPDLVIGMSSLPLSLTGVQEMCDADL